MTDYTMYLHNNVWLYMFIYDFDTLYDYWLCFCKTLLDTVWLCKNQFHLYWLFLTLFYSVWLNFILSCLVLLKLIILNHVWTGLTVFDSALIFFLKLFDSFCAILLYYVWICLNIFNSVWLFLTHAVMHKFCACFSQLIDNMNPRLPELAS